MNEKCSVGIQPETKYYSRVAIEDGGSLKVDRQQKEEIGRLENGHLEFDPYAHGNQKNATSFWGVVVHLFIVAASPTMMNLPETFESVGYVIGFFGCVATVIFYATCMHTIVSIDYILCKKLQRSSMSYAEIVYYSFLTGPQPFRRLANAAKMVAYANFLCVWALSLIHISEPTRPY